MNNETKHKHTFGGMFKCKCSVCGELFLASEIERMEEGTDYEWKGGRDGSSRET